MDESAPLNPKAVALGWLTDVIGSTVVAAVIGFIAGMSAVANGIRPDDVGAAIAASTGVRWASVAIGVAFVAVGGYVAARIAGESEMKNAVAVGVVNLVLSVPFLVLGPFTGTTMFTLASMVLMLPAAMAGGHLRIRQVS